jgi:cutinase
MKAQLAILFPLLASASPIESRQSRVGSTANEFTQGGCKPVIMLFARGSTEIGNMGTVCGPPTANTVKQAVGADQVAVEGIEYGALLSTNFLDGGADPRGIQAMKTLIQKANTDCPTSKLVVGGYSQGAALTHRAVEDLPQAQKDQIVAAFTFGDTQFQQVRASNIWLSGTVY